MTDEREKFSGITPETIYDKEALISFIPLAEMVARRELKRSSSGFLDFNELVNLGLIKINSLIQEAHEKNQSFNASYIIQGIAWEIKNQQRKDANQRGEFRSFSGHVTGEFQETENNNFTLQEIREAVLEAVLSFDEVAFEISDNKTLGLAEQMEFEEIKTAIREAITLLPENYRQIIELRFYKNIKGTDIAEKLGISSARVTKVVQLGLAEIKNFLIQKQLL